MKKYSKLILVAGAAVSFLCFLVYKYRYDRLYNLMQVLDVFGSPPDSRCGGTSSNVTSSVAFPVSVPYWQRLDEGLEIYSAYCTPTVDASGPCPLITALAARKRRRRQSNRTDDDTLSLFHCSVRYEGSLKPLEGVFSFTEERVKSASSPPGRMLRLHCEPKFPTKVPYGVSFYSSQGGQGRNVAVEPLAPQAAGVGTLHLCILPDTFLQQHQLASLRESLMFHALVGVTRVTLYAALLPHSLQNLIRALEADLGIQVKWHPWSPSLRLGGDVTTALVSEDCYQQSRGGRFENYAVMESNHVLMPRTVVNVSSYLSSQVSQLAAGAHAVPVRRFCAEYPTDKKAANLGQHATALLQSTYYSQQLSLGLTADIQHFAPTGSGSQSLDEVAANPSQSDVNKLADELTINEYGPCDSFDFSSHAKTSVYDATAHRFFQQLEEMARKYAKI